MNRVLVVGSINMDMVVEAARFPAPGETISGRRFSTCAGGKGANQAVAARRLGAQVSILACVGDDPFGHSLRAGLEREGVDTCYVRTVTQVATGVASILLSQGENSIVVVPGANYELSEADVLAAEDAFAAADVILCQLEIPLAAVEAAGALAFRHRKPFLLNPAPAIRLPEKIHLQTTLLTPNQHELGILFPSAGTGGEGWRQVLVNNAHRLLMTRGVDGVWFADAAGKLWQQEAFPVNAVDSTGAGDAFNGALAAFWGEDFHSLVRRASAAAALSVTRYGAQGGLPTGEELRQFMAGVGSAGGLSVCSAE